MPENTSTQKQGTERPWKFACDSYGRVRHSRKYDCVYAGNGSSDHPLVTVAARIENTQDAQLIVRAVNAHDALVEAAKGVLSQCDTCWDDGDNGRIQCADPHHQALRAALKLAEAEE